MYRTKQHSVIAIVVISMCVLVVECGLNELCEQIDYYQKKPLFHCLDYDDYGCWCGPGGSGPPVDGVDACCRDHDHCYDRILANGTCNPYVAQYHFKKGQCLDAEGTCLSTLCKCDQVISICLNKQEYHWQYYGWRPFHSCKGKAVAP